MIRGQMVALQEELDWQCYQFYDLLSESFRYDGDDPPELSLGQRAFEIVMARQMAKGDLETAWFERHGSIPIIELPGHWPEAYRTLVERRIEIIETNKEIGLIERPEFKSAGMMSPGKTSSSEPCGTGSSTGSKAPATGPLPALTSRPFNPPLRLPTRPAATTTSCKSPHCIGDAPTSAWPPWSMNWLRASRSRSCPSYATSLRGSASGRSGNARGTSRGSRMPGRTWAISRTAQVHLCGLPQAGLLAAPGQA